MINLFRKKKKRIPEILIDCSDNAIHISNVKIDFPLHLNTLKEILGEASKQEHDLLWRVVWDDLGIYTDYASWDAILRINFLLSDEHDLNHFPEKFFTGQIMVDEKEIQDEDFGKFDLKKNQVQQLTYKGKHKPYAISIGKNFDYKTEIPKGKYTIEPLDEEIIAFEDFGFKLSVIQELMYNKKLLQPAFDLHEFAKWYDKRTIDIEEEGYEPIPEVTQYFKNLPIPKRFAKELTEIYQDGGNKIYLQLLRFGEGWEEYWDIESIEDVKHFPNLKKATLCYAKDNIVEELNKIGIEARYL